ncbi:myocyte-specific enhancer factor 2C-like [Syngnathus acus]|uniref:myocyte-specific enhancer factor 2C-like n=1 Tax=Syngnathus acus TaxID=161584 RepID=UPI001886254C|nr:myocyte-specific enhancer factor 2C-like [Syngnathus acus]
MGRKKIQIARIVDERNRHVTFTKRKFGLMKKAYELSVLCDCEIALIVFNSANRLFQYASTDMDKVLLKYTECNEPHENRTNADIIHTLRKKGLSGSKSPDMEADDDSAGQSPETDDKYLQMGTDVDLMLNRQPICGLPACGYEMGASSLLYPQAGIGGAAAKHNLLPIHHASMQRMAACPQRPPGSQDEGNGVYSNQCPSPAMMSPGGVSQSLQDKSPPMSHMPANKSGNMVAMSAMINRSQTAQTLSSPAACTSLPGAAAGGYPPSSLSSFGAEFSMAGELTSLTAFGSAGLGPVDGWLQPQRRDLHDLRSVPLAHMGHLCHNANFPSGHDLHIKSEPASPSGERVVARPGRSPAGSASSCGSSYDDDGGGRVLTTAGGDFLLRPAAANLDERSSPSVKRTRLTEGWAA